jgi:hypothetical protein
MEAENNQPKPEAPRPRTAEKVIQPLSPDLTPSHASPKLVTPSPAVYSQPTAEFDLTAGMNDVHRVPKLDLRKHLEEGGVKRVSARHKSLMILAVLGLLSAVFSIFAAISVSHAIQQAQLINPQAAKTAQAGLNIIYAGIVFDLFINIYLLIAKNSHTVATVLKVFVVLQFINVFGVFWGGSPTQGISLLIDGVYLLYTYIVLNIVKSGRPI